MKVIDLLVKIANGEVPEKISFLPYDTNNEYAGIYIKKDSNYLKEKWTNVWLFEKDILDILNDEVEIIEEEKKIPEKLEWNKNDFTYPEGNLMSEETTDMLMEIQDKVNFILDYLKSKGDE